MKKILIETISFTPKVKLSEGLKSKNGNPIVEGILATVEVKNGIDDVRRQIYFLKYDNVDNNSMFVGELKETKN